ncbi:MAG: tryptophan-rich sensory protein [Candidatus Bathyarchaeia archaeon]
MAGSTTIIGGRNTAQISDANPTLITPAGYVFSILGIIYILLGIFILYQASSKKDAREFRLKVGYLFIASSILNIFWLFLWQFEYLIFSVIVMFLLLATLIAVYLRLEVGKSAVSLREKIAFHVPFSVYMGWITIASIANVATTLVWLNGTFRNKSRNVGYSNLNNRLVNYITRHNNKEGCRLWTCSHMGFCRHCS